VFTRQIKGNLYFCSQQPVQAYLETVGVAISTKCVLQQKGLTVEPQGSDWKVENHHILQRINFENI